MIQVNHQINSKNIHIFEEIFIHILSLCKKLFMLDLKEDELLILYSKEDELFTFASKKRNILLDLFNSCTLSFTTSIKSINIILIFIDR